MKKLSIIACSILAILLIGEFFCRLYLLRKIPREYIPKTTIGKIQLFLSGGSYMFEFRDQKFLIDKPADVYRIMVLGGSTTECSYVPYTKGWVYLLGEKLNAIKPTSKRIETVNLGFIGACSGEEYFNLVTHFDLIRPDLILVYNGYNDLLGSNLTYATYFLEQARVYEILKNDDFFLKAKFFLNKHSALYNRLADNLHDANRSLNNFIFKHKLFGIGKQKRPRAFPDVKWYKNVDYIWGERDYVGGKFIADVFYSEQTKTKLSSEEYRFAEELLKSVLNNKGEVNPDTYLKKIMQSEATEETKRNILAALNMDEIRFEIGDLKIVYNPLDISGNANIHHDLLPEVYRYNLVNMAAFAKEKNVPLVFIFQPFLTEKLLRLDKGIDEHNFKGMSAFDLEANRHVASVYDLRKKKMEEVASEFNLPFFNYQSMFDNYDNKDVYIDSCHNTELGLDLLAASIAKHLIEIAIFSTTP
ncbi:MAG: SGNH/GDSL hydrolase family protein [Candidatus Omnitrophica bacterium]|nr:SGNH/GDSL hydrolase family protein [Candidatus Omnitrophota bacterium]